jgi:hypothetical protein
LDQNFLDTCLHEKGKVMAVDKVSRGQLIGQLAMWLGQPATTW